MKKEILEALTTKFPGVSASILGRIADKLAKTATTAEQVKTAVEGVTIQQVIESYTDSRVTEATNTARENAIKDYETRHKLKDGVKITEGEPQPTPQKDETATMLQQLLERIEKMEASKLAESRTQQLTTAISKLPENLRKVYERIPVDKYNDEEFSKMMGEITTEVDTLADQLKASGAVTGRPKNNNGEKNKTELTEDQMKAISHREGIPASGEQPF